jgi:ribonuclease J
LSLNLTVHRGTRQIGGSRIEIAHPAGDRPILDAGRPLDAPDGASGLLPASLDTSCAATVLISHPHQDHWGLVNDLPADWPVWTGAGSAKLITITGDILRQPFARQFKTWTSRSGSFAIGPYTVTPILTDHSAYDAYMPAGHTASHSSRATMRFTAFEAYAASARRPSHNRAATGNRGGRLNLDMARRNRAGY